MKGARAVIALADRALLILTALVADIRDQIASRIRVPEKRPPLRPFHIALQVRDLDEARRFYRETLGCRQGRSDAQWADFDLFGHQLVCHLNPALGAEGPRTPHRNPVDGEAVPVPHCGVVLEMREWKALAERLRENGTPFLIEPTLRFAGDPGEQGTFFVTDPSGNALEFKGFADLRNLFRSR